MDYLSGAGHHKPSMLIDIEKGNPTEIDFINGKISEYGQRFNIPVPLHAALTALIKAKEQYPAKQ
jgi:2-dehydropantoate 2-reductase